MAGNRKESFASHKSLYKQIVSMQKIYSIAVWIAVSVLVSTFASCTPKEVRDKLTEAESIMEEAPDSALHIITSIDTTDLKNRKDWAKYALLNVQARTKTNEVITSDSLISRAVTYYQEKGDSPDLMKSLFYNADILCNQKKFDRASYIATNSYDLALKFKDSYWIAKTAEQLSDIYIACYNEVEAKKYNWDAIVYYEKANRRLNHLYSWCDRALLEGNSLNYDRAIEIADSIADIASVELNDSSLLAYCIDVKFPICFNAGKYGEAKECFSKLEQLKSFSDIPIHFFAHLSLIYLREGKISKSKYLIDSIDINQCDQRDRAAFYNMYRQFYLKLGDYKNAYDYLDSIIHIQNKITWDIMDNNIALAQKGYYDNKSVESLKKESKSKKQVVIIVIIALSIIIIVFMIYRISIKIKDNKIEKSVNEIIILTEQIKNKSIENKELSNSIHGREEQISNMDMEIENLFRNQWNTLNRLCNEFFEKESQSSKLSSIASIEKEIKKIVNRKNIGSIEESVNKYMNNIVVALREQCSFLKEEDFIFIILVYAGFAPRTICMFTNIKFKHFYNKRSRLIERIKKSDVKDKEWFISKFPK